MQYSNWIRLFRFIYYAARVFFIGVVIHWILFIIPRTYGSLAADSPWLGVQGYIVAGVTAFFLNIVFLYLPLFLRPDRDARLIRLLSLTDTEINFLALLILFFYYMRLSTEMEAITTGISALLSTLLTSFVSVANAILSLFVTVVSSLRVSNVLLILLAFLLASSMTRLAKILLDLPLDGRPMPKMPVRSTAQQAQQAAAQAAAKAAAQAAAQAAKTEQARGGEQQGSQSGKDKSGGEQDQDGKGD